jgi:hypothetical protein
MMFVIVRAVSVEMGRRRATGSKRATGSPVEARISDTT